jgi:hypothetical protein
MNESTNSTTIATPAVQRNAAGEWVRKALDNWMERHRLPFNFWIHMLGIPLAVASLPLFVLAEWYWGVAALVLGYFLQWVGHLAEGNDLGEWAGIKGLLGLPYVGISPRWQQDNDKVRR